MLLATACEDGGSPPPSPRDAQVLDADGNDGGERDAAELATKDASVVLNDAGERVCGEPGDVLRPYAPQDIAGCVIYRGEITIADVQWANLDGFESLRVVEGDVALFRSPKLADLRGLANLERVGGVFSINMCDSLTTLSQLTSLREVGELQIRQDANGKLPPSEVETLRSRLSITGIPDAGP